MFSASLSMPGPKHSTSIPFGVELAVPLSVDEKEVAFVAPNPVPVVAVNPHADVLPVVLCARTHSLLPPTLQMVIPLMPPVTVHLKVKVSSGQVEGAAMNCPATSPEWKICQLPTYNDGTSYM